MADCITALTLVTPVNSRSLFFHVILRHHYAAMLNVDDMHTPAICRLDDFDSGAGTVHLVVKEATDRRAPSAYFAMGSLDGIVA